MSTDFQHGNREVSVSITGSSTWEKDGMSRTYFTLDFVGAKLDPISKLYEIHSGGTRDATISVDGRKFGYQLGISCDSKTKRASAIKAIESLLQNHGRAALMSDLMDDYADDTCPTMSDLMDDYADDTCLNCGDYYNHSHNCSDI